MRRARNGVRSVSTRHDPHRATGHGRVGMLLLLVGVMITLTLTPPTGAMASGSAAVVTAQHVSAETTVSARSENLQGGPCRTMCPAMCSYADCGALGGTPTFETGSWAPEPVFTRSVGSHTLRLTVGPVGGRRPPVSRQALSISRT